MKSNMGKCRFRAKPVYIGGQLVYCLGMVAMAITRCGTFINMVFSNIM